MRPFATAWIGVLLVTSGVVPLRAQDEVRGDFSAQGPGSHDDRAARERPEIVFSKDVSGDAGDQRPSLPSGLRSLGATVYSPAVSAKEHSPAVPAEERSPAVPAEIDTSLPSGPRSFGTTPDSPPGSAQQPPRSGPVPPEKQPAANQPTSNQLTSNQPPAKDPGTKASASPRLRLGSPTPGSGKDSDKPSDWLNLKAHRSISSMLGGLSIAIGLFLLLAWAVRRRMPKGTARLPDEIIEVLGRTTLAPKQALHLVRVGGKLIVVSVTATGTETLTEVTDPSEVTRILAACQRHSAHSSSTDFRKVFEQLGREPASGFLET